MKVSARPLIKDIFSNFETDAEVTTCPFNFVEFFVKRRDKLKKKTKFDVGSK